MVIMMETWFLADVEALRGYYGQEVQLDILPEMAELEELTKNDVKAALKKATRPFKKTKGIYDDDTKLDHSIEILKNLNPHKVAARAPHCKCLLETLQTKLNDLNP